MCLLQVFFVIQTRTLELTDFADFESRLVFVEVRFGLNDSLASLSFLDRNLKLYDILKDRKID